MEEFKQQHKHGDDLFNFEFFNQTRSANEQTVYLHWHEEIEWIFCRTGSISVFLNGKVFKVNEGELFTIPGEAIHYIITNEQCQYFTCVFNKKLLEFNTNDYISYHYIKPFISGNIRIKHMIKSQDSYIKNIYEKIFMEEQNKEITYQLNIRIYLLKLFEYFIRNDLLVDDNQITHDNSPMEQVIDYIADNYNKKITSIELANIMNYNPQYFSRYFKSVLGYTPIEFVNHYRIERASELLFSSDLSILEVGLECGFESSSYFIKKFKEIKGTSPNNYRKLLLENYSIIKDKYD